MRAAPIASLLAALSIAACGGSDAGYRAPSSGCDGWPFCPEIQTRGRFDALHGFLGAGEVVAYRDLHPDGTAAAWFSTPTAEESIAPSAVRSTTSLRPGRAEVIVAVPRVAGEEQYEHALFGGRIDLRRWSPGSASALLAESVVPASWALCATGEWLWTVEGESAEFPYGNCGHEVLRNLTDGRVDSVTDGCTAMDWVGRFTPDCGHFTGGWTTVHVDLASGLRVPLEPSWRLDSFYRDDRFLLLVDESAPDPEDDAESVRIVRASDLGDVAAFEDVDRFGQRTFSADGAWFAYDRYEGGEWTQVQAVHLGDGRRLSVEPFGYSHSAVAFSPAGDRAAFLAWSDAVEDVFADLVLVDLGDGSARVLDRFASRAWLRHAPEHQPFAFDATGRWFVFARGSENGSVRDRERELVVVDAATGGARTMAPAVACRGCTQDPLEMSAARSADGRWLAWISPGGSLFLADLAEGGAGARVSEGPVTDVVFGEGELAWISDGYLLVAPLVP